MCLYYVVSAEAKLHYMSFLFVVIAVPFWRGLFSEHTHTTNDVN